MLLVKRQFLIVTRDHILSQSVQNAFQLVIAPQYRRVFADGKPLELTRREFDLLYYLAQHPGQVFTRAQLYEQVWGDFYELGGDETVKAHVKTLRKKLSALDTNLIENEWGVGYRFVPPM